jgi:hypothetical protein
MLFIDFLILDNFVKTEAFMAQIIEAKLFILA